MSVGLQRGDPLRLLAGQDLGDSARTATGCTLPLTRAEPVGAVIEGAPMDELHLSVTGMSCVHCVRAISASVSDVPHVRTVHVDLASQTVHVTGTEDEAAVRAAIADAGYEVA